MFCSPKPFLNEAMRNQNNALRSWRAIHRDVEILIFGAPIGAAEIAAEVDAKLIPEIECSSSGAPSFNAMAAYASRYARYGLLVYANCDVLFDKSLVPAMQMAARQFGQFLLVGERMDLPEGVMLDVSNSMWGESLIRLADADKLACHGPTGVDYFGFTRGMWDGLPLVYMGRAMCDQALLHYCLGRRIPIVDATLAVIAVHQFHGYQHVPGGLGQVFNGEDTLVMSQAHRLRHCLPTIADCMWQLMEDGRIQTGRTRRPLLRRMEFALRYEHHFEKAALLLRALQYLRGRSGVQPRRYSRENVLAAWRLANSRGAGRRKDDPLNG